MEGHITPNTKQQHSVPYKDQVQICAQLGEEGWSTSFRFPRSLQNVRHNSFQSTLAAFPVHAAYVLSTETHKPPPIASALPVRLCSEVSTPSSERTRHAPEAPSEPFYTLEAIHAMVNTVLLQGGAFFMPSWQETADNVYCFSQPRGVFGALLPAVLPIALNVIIRSFIFTKL